MGTSEFAVPALQEAAGCCEILAVVTRPDRGRGRGRKLSPSPVAERATALGLEPMKPENVNDPEVVGRMRSLAPELFAVVAFGGILSAELLAVPALGSINLHGSLLPAYRGAAPVARALWDGREETGITTMWMNEGVDTGDIILQRTLPIAPMDDAGSLSSRLAEAGAPLLVESLVLAAAGRAPRRPQGNESATYARKLSREDGIVSWSLDAETIWNRQRAVTPRPGAIASHRGRRLRVAACAVERKTTVAKPPGTILEIGETGVLVACSQGALRITRVQPESRAEMPAADWAHGARLAVGDTLGGGVEVQA